ncbi:type I DNA topoisomerase [Acidipila sp. EB88]|uniref:type I DNA topoisomerase n=1 Tax=Acidipila sp. EB88 TaxID=2305226 RepID=UPI000F5D65BA|nr:type I DNA topoisomerase [Acidipila sp. EB88]RRA48845.1 type I DNA topoisomerase [Acidipila sp. EB88]
MGKSLVIVESPAKAKTINKYLGSDFIVEASLGHIKDLPKSKIGVDLDGGSFRPDLIVIPGKEKVVDHLKKLARKMDHIYLAPDPDREGEAIAAHLEEELRGIGTADIQRVTFNEITPKAVLAAFDNARKVNVNLVDAQQTRRVLDRIVGYQISPLLWDKVRRGLSAGRVQTVAVRLIVERESEIKAFKPVEHWTVDAVLQSPAKASELFTARLVGIDGERISVDTVSQPALPNGDAARAAVAGATTARWTVRTVEKKERKRNAPAPFTTSKLQQDAAGKLGFGVKQTMGLAQRLYEGVELGKDKDGQPDTIGLITYMRTDSTRVSPDAITETRAWIGQELGEQYLPEKPNSFKSKKDAQDAHEAIRPTHPEMNPDSLRKYLSDAEYRLYRLIWQRFIASQMMPAVFDVTTVEIDAHAVKPSSHVYNYRLSGSVLKFDGFLKVYEDTEDGDEEQKLPALNEKQELVLAPAEALEAAALKQRETRLADARRQYEMRKAKIEARAEDQDLEDSTLGAMLAELGEAPRESTDPLKVRSAVDTVQKFTEPPARYSEASLVKVLEERGIGRPSTYAAIINTIQEREYVQKVGGKKNGGFIPTEIGTVVAELLVKNFPYIFDTQYTARLETELDDVEAGKEPWTSLLQGFYGHLKKELVHASEHMEDLKRMEVPTDQKCDLCGSPLVMKWGKFGTFYACSAYDKKVKGSCSFTKENYDTKPNLNLPEGDAEDKEEFCEACGRPMVLRNGRFGPFMACTGYNEDPACKTVRRLTSKQQQKPAVPLDENCPKCDSQLVLRSGQYGEFVSCSAYPKCKYIKQDTIGMHCPKCADGEIAQKKSRFGTMFYSCTNYPKCDFTANHKPIDQHCPECDSPYLMEKTLKSGVYLVCPNNKKGGPVAVVEAPRKKAKGKKGSLVADEPMEPIVCSFTERIGDAPSADGAVAATATVAVKTVMPAKAAAKKAPAKKSAKPRPGAKRERIAV